VRLSREFGFVSEFQCQRYDTDLKKVRNKQMSFQDFVRNLQAGKYLRNLGNGYCEQVELPEPVVSLDQYDEGKLRTIRIQKIESAGFSANTKARFTPSIPFKMVYGGQEFTVSTMTLYHPCPLRIENVQSDAVLSLNDPSFGNPSHIVLIPLVGRNSADLSVSFLNKIAPEVITVSAEDPASGQYLTRDIPTGANWTLSKLFGISAGKGAALEVANGYYQWTGMPALERVRKETPGTITYAWEPTGRPSPKYIMLDTPVAMSPSDLATVTQRLPITPPEDAIHAVLYDGGNPLNRGIVHKQGPPVPPGGCPTRETFTNADLNKVLSSISQTEDPSGLNISCDPWQTWALTANRGYTTNMIIELMFNVIVLVAAAVGAYFAIVAVVKMYDVQVRGVAEGIGKITAVVAKDLQQKATNIRNAVGSVTNIAKNPLAFARGQAQNRMNAVVSDVQGQAQNRMNAVVSDVQTLS